MKFHKTSIQNNSPQPSLIDKRGSRNPFPLIYKGDQRGLRAGFTIMEVLISLGIFVILLGVTTPFVLQFYKRYQLDAERATVIALLRQARTMSLTGENGKDHGVHIASTQYTVYEGTNYASRDVSQDQTFERNTNVTTTGPSEVVFRYLTGTSASQSFSLTNDAKQGYIYVNTEGSIDWQ